MYRNIGKRLFDFGVAAISLLFLSPLLLVIAVLVRYYMGSPVLFRQQRPGHYGKPFTLLKFRTMSEAKDSQGRLLSDAERLTAFGRFLRSTSLDELPELINVIRGEVSLVGPRPLLLEYLPRYTAEQMRRHHVRPGITGWAQVNGRNTLSWEEKFQLDLWYVDRLDFWLDVKILLLTLATIAKREGINQPGQVTAERFLGVDAYQQEEQPSLVR